VDRLAIDRARVVDHDEVFHVGAAILRQRDEIRRLLLQLFDRFLHIFIRHVEGFRLDRDPLVLRQGEGRMGHHRRREAQRIVIGDLHILDIRQLQDLQSLLADRPSGALAEELALHLLPNLALESAFDHGAGRLARPIAGNAGALGKLASDRFAGFSHFGRLNLNAQRREAIRKRFNNNVHIGKCEGLGT